MIHWQSSLVSKENMWGCQIIGTYNWFNYNQSPENKQKNNIFYIKKYLFIINYKIYISKYIKPN